MTDIYQPLREILKRHTISRVARETGLTPQCVSHFINGKHTPQTSTVHVLADYLHRDYQLYVNFMDIYSQL